MVSQWTRITPFGAVCARRPRQARRAVTAGRRSGRNLAGHGRALGERGARRRRAACATVRRRWARVGDGSGAEGSTGAVTERDTGTMVCEADVSGVLRGFTGIHVAVAGDLIYDAYLDGATT